MPDLSQGPARILAVDDEKNILGVYQTCLMPRRTEEKRGASLKELAARLFETTAAVPPPAAFDLVTCSQGDEAVETVRKALADERPFQVVFLDVRMPPGPDGIWAAAEIRKLDPHIEIVIVTGYSDVPTEELVQRVPPADKLLYLQKPLHPQEIWQFATALVSKWHTERRRQEARAAEQRRTHEAIQEREERFRLLTDHTPVSIQGYDTEGRVLYWNKAAERIFGYTAAEAYGRSLRELIIPDRLLPDHARELDAGRNVTASGQFLEAREVQLRDKGGRAVPVHCIHTAICLEGREPLFFRIDVDLSERKKSEAALIHSARMAAVGTLAGGVAHEFNNIHAAALGYIELALLQPLDDKLREYLAVVQEVLLRASGVTRRLLDFSSRKAKSHVPVALTALVESTLKLVRTEFESEGIEIAVHVNEPVSVFADPGQIGQVILNLMINARHAMIDTSVKRLDLSTGKEGERGYVRVKDTGIGIRPEHLADLFVPFFTTKGEHAESGSGQAAVRGTGLGLSVSKTIVENHGGEITVESAVGLGSTFTVWLPLSAEAETVEDDEEEASLLVKPNARILVLDDERHVCQFILEVLEAHGYRAEATDDGHAALARLREEEIDLVLVDLQLPAMGGDEFLDRLEAAALPKPPVCLVMTGKLVSENLDAIEGRAVFGILEKPFTARALLRQISAALLAREGQPS